MTEDSNGKVTVRELYLAVDDLRTSLDERFQRLEDAFSNNYTTRGVCSERHRSIDAWSASQEQAARDDRQQMWDAIHALEKTMKWAAGTAVTFALGIVSYLVTSHL